MKFNFEATGIGSLPLKDSKKACQLIFDNFKSIPFWPQLPKRSFLENMYVQFSQGLPGLVIDERNKKIHIDTSKVAQEMEETYSRYVDADLEFFRIKEDYAEGFYAFLDHSRSKLTDMKFAKGQLTGPVSFALSVTDQNKRSIIYDKDLFEISTKVLSMKARWQIKRLKDLGRGVIIFIDEPYLVSIGSSYVNINIEEAVKRIDEVIDSIKSEGALAGIHCCGNTDWPLLLKRDIDILNFDAYNFLKEFFLYTTDIINFLRKGKTIAWGIVPSSDAIDKETKTALNSKLKEAVKYLIDKGMDKDSISSLITPSCGLGTLDEERTAKILAMTKTLSMNLA